MHAFRSARPLALALSLAGCASQSLHPSAPAGLAAEPVPDPPPSRVVVHATLFADAMARLLDGQLPRTGDGTADFMAGHHAYRWSRSPLSLKFDRGRIGVAMGIEVHVKLLGDRSFPVELSIEGEPVVTPDYQVRLQSTDVVVKAGGSIDAINRSVEERLRLLIAPLLEQFALDLRPIVEATYARVAKPLPLPALGDAHACAELRVAAVEAGPTVLAGDLEKDLALVVLPSVTSPCRAAGSRPPPLPLLANVASLSSGPFQVVVPIAASYDELARALAAGMGGRLRFSKQHPDLYLEQPEAFPSGGEVVVKLRLGGTARVAGIDTGLHGELYFSGHPRVVDNQVLVPDLELTADSASALLKLELMLDGRELRDQARAALRLDVSERLRAVRDKLSTELSFDEGATGAGATGVQGCMRAEVLHTEVAGIWAHPSFLRIYVRADAQASLYVPCKH